MEPPSRCPYPLWSVTIRLLDPGLDRGRLAAEWRATEAAVIEIEAEIPYPLSRVVTDIEEALRRKSFHDRIAEKLATDDDWSREGPAG
jgi:hypothetical protein